MFPGKQEGWREMEEGQQIECGVRLIIDVNGREVEIRMNFL